MKSREGAVERQGRNSMCIVEEIEEGDSFQKEIKVNGVQNGRKATSRWFSGV